MAHKSCTLLNVVLEISLVLKEMQLSNRVTHTEQVLNPQKDVLEIDIRI